MNGRLLRRGEAAEFLRRPVQHGGVNYDDANA